MLGIEPVHCIAPAQFFCSSRAWNQDHTGYLHTASSRRM